MLRSLALLLLCLAAAIALSLTGAPPVAKSCAASPASVATPMQGEAPAFFDEELENSAIPNVGEFEPARKCAMCFG